MLVATQLHKSFGDRQVLKSVDMRIQPGHITCLLGPSGTGKTTLLRALALLDYPDQGSIAVDDLSYTFPLSSTDHIQSPYPQLTVVFQSLFLWPHLTLRENILLPARNIANRDVDADLNALIDFLEMRHFIDRYPNQASLGQRQRVALARALMLNPKYILMDEITSSLDVEQISKILTKLEMLKDKGIGIFIITHLLNFAKRAGDQVCFMDGGQVVEAGPPRIIDNPQSERFKKFVSTVALAS